MSNVALLAMKAAHAPLVTRVADRFAPGYLPQLETARPAITWSLVSRIPEPAMGVNTGVVRARYQFNIWARTWNSVEETLADVEAAFDRVRGTFGGVVVDDCFVSVAGGNYDDQPEDASGSSGEHHLPVDVQMNYQR